jgi:hypothetical protein
MMILELAFILVSAAAGAGVFVLEWQNYRQVTDELDRLAWEAYYHERIWSPEGENHGD